MDATTIAEDLSFSTPLTCEDIKRGVEILEKNNAIQVSSPIVFEAYDMVSEEDQKIARDAMEEAYKEMAGVRADWIVTDDFCTQEYNKGGENKMELYEVYLVDKGTSEFDIVRLVSKSRESAKVKAFNMSKFADLDYDVLAIEVTCKITWDVDED